MHGPRSQGRQSLDACVGEQLGRASSDSCGVGVRTTKAPTPPRISFSLGLRRFSHRTAFKSGSVSNFFPSLSSRDTEGYDWGYDA